jgi:hypothetical protein
MNTWPPRRAARALASTLPAAAFAMLAACAVGPGGPYGGDDYVGGYYEPVGYDYGGWGGGYGYRVGPARGGERGGGPGPHAFRPAPASRPTPSIPSRGGGGRGGGGHR